MNRSAAPMMVVGWSDEHLQMLHQGSQISWHGQVGSRV
jgi:hypothetical protein